MLNIETLGRLRNNLQSIKDGIVPAYAAKTGLSQEQIANMMTRETWMTAQDAKGYGFADEIIPGGQNAKTQVQNLAYVNVLHSYANVPPMFLDAMGSSLSFDDCREACMKALEYCIECLHQCEACSNADDTKHQECIATCKACVECCAVCAHDCEDEAMMDHVMASCQACMDACTACVAACQNCGESCQDCMDACKVCGDACQLCATVCSQVDGVEPSANDRINVPSARLSSEAAQVDIEREAQSLREYVQLYK